MAKIALYFSHLWTKSMKRALLHSLIEWKNKKNRSPLILRGARQVGKTYLVEIFAKQYFDNSITLNLETETTLAPIFSSLDPQKIIQTLSLSKQEKIIPGKTLLFLDEIQNCPMAIVALRYFKEKMPELHVIATGSLLEFTLNNEKISIPVGRIEFLFLYPLSFTEFLIARDLENLQTHLKRVSLKNPLDNALHQQLLALSKEYFLLGGMPAVISEYIQTKDSLECQRKQNNLLLTYQYDFGKYTPLSKHKYLQSLFDKTPSLIAKTFKYNSIDPGYRSREIKEAIQLLSNAGVIHVVYASSASGLPLRAQVNEKKFKLLFLDLGLVQRSLQLENLILQPNVELQLINSGQLAEQFVGQELLAYQDPSLPAHLHYWLRDKKSSMAEIDYVITFKNRIYPIEVKYGKTGHLQSLILFMKEKGSEIGIKVSQAPLSFQNQILNIPFYLISELPRLLDLHI